uniref:Uncharacterized protein n=1 Tax=Tetraselmis sp. GSL018 TaxID=582737 RepID=A0A061RYB2_9CHLO|mmetsp:Transcript_25117/g.59856  ORF Transcript_25117/g.59856 Transcript_25117/m.59856 type:complete len:111 (+) Transcript_25117:165-497(+)|eukprot:CAMPEP_0177609010 /NCGR_PEP_ID=MMETSP0419_2-20121207/18815_1 /TAXON_ID=582737 /ORGANISM="Tetraselmis sp., Strain GSL018" /LENGTH=110 /DNA_ID=CAMNT_0019103815 /DNA_START=113 /DNA_END=445 /DNA_ORIENTATION=-
MKSDDSDCYIKSNDKNERVETSGIMLHTLETLSENKARQQLQKYQRHRVEKVKQANELRNGYHNLALICTNDVEFLCCMSCKDLSSYMEENVRNLKEQHLSFNTAAHFNR